MKSQRSKRILREYIREILKEDDGYGGMIGASYDMMPYGSHFASQDALYSTFVKPFVDVVQVAAGKTKEVSKRAQTLFKVSFEAFMVSIIPWLTTEFKEIFDEEKDALAKIKSEYNDVYEATWDAFRNNDIALCAFFAYPGYVMTGLAAAKSPGSALHLMNVLSGGSLATTVKGIKNAYKKSGGGYSAPHGPMSPSGGYVADPMPGGFFGEGALHEDGKGKKKKKLPPIGQVVTNKKLVAMALESDRARKLQAVSREIIKKTLSNVLQQAEAVLTAKSIQELETKLGKNVKGSEKLNNLKPEERQQLEAQLLSNVKKSMVLFYVKNLQAQVKVAIEAGIPKDSPFVSDYAEVIQKIKNF